MLLLTNTTPARASISPRRIRPTSPPGAGAVLVMARSTPAAAPATPPLPLLSELFAVFGSNSSAVAVAALSNAPAALIVAVTLMVVLAPEARLAMVQGSAAQPEPLTLVMVRLVGVSVSWMLVAVDGPAFATTSVYEIDWPAVNGPLVTS